MDSLSLEAFVCQYHRQGAGDGAEQRLEWTIAQLRLLGEP